MKSLNNLTALLVSIGLAGVMSACSSGSTSDTTTGGASNAGAAGSGAASNVGGAGANGGAAQGGASSGGSSGSSAGNAGGSSGGASAGSSGGASGSPSGGASGSSSGGASGAPSGMPGKPVGAVLSCTGAGCPHGACGNGGDPHLNCGDVYSAPLAADATLCAVGNTAQYCLLIDTPQTWSVYCKAGVATAFACDLACGYDKIAMTATCG